MNSAIKVRGKPTQWVAQCLVACLKRGFVMTAFTIFCASGFLDANGMYFFSKHEERKLNTRVRKEPSVA